MLDRATAVSVTRKAWPGCRPVDAAEAKTRQINDEIYRNAVFAESSTIVLMGALEKCIQDEEVHESCIDLAEDLWSVREELEGIKYSIPDAISGRQAELVPPPFIAKSGFRLVKEAAERAHTYLVKLQQYCDDDTIAICIQVLEEIAQIRETRVT